MRTFDFTPYYRSTVGFDRLFDLLDKSIRSDWPAYNIEKKGEDQYRITMTVAGFSPNEIELVQHGSTLLVTSQKDEQQGAEVLHRGIPSSFRQSFNLADHVKVVGANMEHGLLTIDLAREVPEELKPRRIDIVSGAETKIAKQDNQQKQIDVSAKKAA
jgi:molecular chaperone IbpA